MYIFVVIEVSGQSVGSIFKVKQFNLLALEDGTSRLSRNVGN